VPNNNKKKQTAMPNTENMAKKVAPSRHMVWYREVSGGSERVSCGTNGRDSRDGGWTTVGDEP
jgi:hypothetical protein